MARWPDSPEASADGWLRQRVGSGASGLAFPSRAWERAKVTYTTDILRDVVSTGIRRNGDDDDNDDRNLNTLSRDFQQRGTVPGENDLVTVKIALNFTFAELLASGITISLERSIPELKAWKSPTKVETRTSLGFRIIPDKTDASAADVEVEWATLNVGLISATLRLIASTNTPVAPRQLDSLIFFPFDGVVAAFVGEFEAFAGVTPDARNGIKGICNTLRSQGYDAYLFDEDDVARDAGIFLWGLFDAVINGEVGAPAWESFKTIKNAVQGYGVSEVGLIGFSHGGGAVYMLSEKLRSEFRASSNGYELKFTAYIDGVNKGSILSETRRPIDSQFHLNIYQGVLGSIRGITVLIGGANMGHGANENDNVDVPGDNPAADIYMLHWGLTMPQFSD